MSKVGILTFHNSNNHGALLQAFAMQETLKKQYENVEIINYISPTMKSAHIDDIFLGFRDKYLDVSKVYTDKYEMLKDYSKIILGSDQIWNPTITGSDNTYFIAGNKRTIVKSYAASLGLKSSDIANYKDFYKDNLEKHRYISIREKSNIDILKKIIGREDICFREHVDPTLLLEKKEYESLLKIDDIKVDIGDIEEYIFYFSYNSDPRFLDFVSMVSLYTKIPIVVSAHFHSCIYINGTRLVSSISPREWLALVKNAKLVFTDSYHGLMFSMIFHKPFYIYTSDSSAVVRLVDVMKKYSLETRVISAVKDLNEISLELDYSKFDIKIEEEKNMALQYLYT